LATDGQRFVALMPAEGSESPGTGSHATLVIGFLDEVRRKVAAQEK